MLIDAETLESSGARLSNGEDPVAIGDDCRRCYRVFDRDGHVVVLLSLRVSG